MCTTTHHPFTLALWVLFALWVAMMLATNYEHYMNGYYGKGLIVTEGDRKFAADCLERSHISDRVPEKCEYYIAITTATPIVRAWHNVRRHYVGCGLWACGDVLRALSDAVGFSLIVFVIAAAGGVTVAMHFLNLVSRFLPSSSSDSVSNSSSRRKRVEETPMVEEGYFVGGGNGGSTSDAHPRYIQSSSSSSTAITSAAQQRVHRAAPRATLLIERDA